MTQEQGKLDQTVDMSIEDILESIDENNRTSTLPTTIITQSQMDALASMSAHLTTEVVDMTKMAALETQSKCKDDEITALKQQLELAQQNARSPEPEGDDCNSSDSDSSLDSDADETDEESDGDVQIYNVDDDGDVNVSDPTVGSSDKSYLDMPQNQMGMPEFDKWEMSQMQHYKPRSSRMKTTPTLRQQAGPSTSTPTDTASSPPVKPKQPSKKTKLKRCRPIWSDDEDSQYDPLTENAQNPNSKVLKVQVTPKKRSVVDRGGTTVLDVESEDERPKTVKKTRINPNPFISYAAKEDNRMELDDSQCSEKPSPSKTKQKFRRPLSHGASPTPSTSAQSPEFPYCSSYFRRNASQWKDGRFKFHHNVLKVAIAALTENCQLPEEDLKKKLDSIGQTVYTSSEAMCKHRWWSYVQQTYELMQTPEVPSFMNDLISPRAQRLKQSTIQKFRTGYMQGQSTLMQVMFFLKMNGREKLTKQDLALCMKDFDYTK